MPRVRTWKVPLTLWLSGLVAKIALSILVSESVGGWVGGTLGFLANVTCVMYIWHLRQESRRREDAAPPS